MSDFSCEEMKVCMDFQWQLYIQSIVWGTQPLVPLVFRNIPLYLYSEEAGRGHVREQFVWHSRGQKCMGKTVFFGAKFHWGASDRIW